MDPRLIDIKNVQARTTLSRTTIYNRVRQGTFPCPVPLGTQKVAWLDTEITGWIEARVRDKGRHAEGRRWRAQAAARARHRKTAGS